jgi:hypothetical protein
MPPDRIQEPWLSFLSEIDRAAPASIALTCIGGFAISLHYGFLRSTGDIDVVEVEPGEMKAWLQSFAGEGSALHRKHRVHLQIVTVADLPYAHQDRVIPIFQDRFERLRLFVLDPIDLVLSKLTRNFDVDIEDAKHLVRSSNLDLDALEARYRDELRPYVTGPPERHDTTVKLWLAAFREERKQRT